MKTETLTLTNFNGRKFKIHTYITDHNPDLLMKKQGLIIVIPGGSFVHLSARESEPVALNYNARGYNCVVMEYNLIQDVGTIYPDAGLNVLTTVKYFREHSQEYNIDPEKIVTLGFSAGGHVASSANTMANFINYRQKYNFDADLVRPNATILGYPLIDLKKIGFPIPEDQMKDIPNEPELRNTALGVTRETPATFIFQAWDDPIVLIGNSIEYIQALNEHHVSCEAHLFDHGKHGFSLARFETSQETYQDNPHAAHWFNLSLEWLNDRFRN